MSSAFAPDVRSLPVGTGRSSRRNVLPKPAISVRDEAFRGGPISTATLHLSFAT